MKLYAPFILLFIVTDYAAGQSLNYPEIFGDDWKKAEEFISSNKDWMIPALEKWDIRPAEALAVVFPELVRYSALRDKMEITLLKALYINLGKDYANFSIGQFQMKPCFAEKIREISPEMVSRRIRKMISDSSDFRNMRSYRSSIVSDLENIRMQLSYLLIFMKICYGSFKVEQMEEEERIRFLAAAYNTGFFKTAAEIRGSIDKKFYNTQLIGKEFYSYSDISLFWYKENNPLR